MVIGERFKRLREEKQISQGVVEKRTGLLRSYISRVENGHTVPSVDTLEKMARALEVPMYRLFTDEAKIEKPGITFSRAESGSEMGTDSTVRAFAKALSRMNGKNQRLLMHLASRMANRTR